MGKEAKWDAIKHDYLLKLQAYINNKWDTDCLFVDSSTIVFPVVDPSTGEEGYMKLKLSKPRGTRNGEGGYIPYDGYAAAEAYKADVAADAANKAAKAAEKAAKEKLKQQKREAKKLSKDLNTKGLENMIQGE